MIFHFHWWHEVTGRRPDREDWFCVLRYCRCGQVQYHAFNTFGDKKWHNLDDSEGCQPWEHAPIKLAAIPYQALLKT